MGNNSNLKKVQSEIKRRTSSIRTDPRPAVELAERDHLRELFLRLVPAIYDYPQVSVDELLRGVALKINAAEYRYLAERLAQVRRKQDLVVVSRDDEDLLLPLRPGFDPRAVPLAAAWTDGGYYTAKERQHSNGARLRKLGLRDGVAGYVSYRLVIFNPPAGRPAWQVEPQEVSASSSYESEALAVELALSQLIEIIDRERTLPAVDEFHTVLFSDCQSLVEALKSPPGEDSPDLEAAGELVNRIRDMAKLFAGFEPRWEPRRLIKQRLGH